MKMFSGKKKYLKIVSLLLVCCMIAGIIGVQPMVAEAETAEVTKDMFTSYNDGNGVVSWESSTEGVTVQNTTGTGDYPLTTTSTYSAATGIQLTVKNITVPEGTTGYSFVVYMGQESNAINYIPGVNYVDKTIAMAFGSDGRYKIWKTTCDKNAVAAELNPGVSDERILAYGMSENMTLTDTVAMNIQLAKGYYHLTVNGQEKISFADPGHVDSANLKLSLHVQKALDSNYSSWASIEKHSFVISEFSHIDASTLGKGFVDDYNNYKTYEIEKRYDSYPLTFEAEVYLPEGDYETYGMIAGTNTIGGGTGFDIRVLSNGQLMIYLRSGYSKTADITLIGAVIPKGQWTHVAVVVDPVMDTEKGQYYAYGYINGVQKAKVGFGYSFWKYDWNAETKEWDNSIQDNINTAWIAKEPIDPTTLVLRNNMVIGANNIPADPNPAEGDTVANTSVYKNTSGANLNSCFQGRIKSVGFWGDVRTAEEISNDYSAGVTVDDENLWGYYEPEEGQDIFDDLSSNRNDAVVHQSWMTESELGEQALVKGEDYAYSMVVVGDTQIINQTSNDSIDPNADGDYEDSTMTQIYRWIAENKDALNIEFVLGVGDITDDNETKAYANANYAYEKYLLANNIRFASVLGDHDRSTGFNSMEYLKDEGYTTYIVENYWKDVKNIEGRMDDTCQVLQVGSLKYLIISLGCGPSPDVLKWASDMCKKYSDHNVIIHTHAYLQYDGTTIDPVNDASIAYTQMESATNESVTIYTDARTDGEDLWETVVEPNENVTLVLSGHVTPLKGVTYSTQTRDDESVVAQLLTNPQNIDGAGLDSSSNIENARPTGMVSILYYDEDGNIVAHRNYSTIQQKYYCDVNQFDNLGNNVIVPGAVKDVELSEGNLLLLPGQTETLTATLTPSTASDTVTWTSSNGEIATVDATTGVVTAVAAGEAVITATAGNCKAECKIWVTTINNNGWATNELDTVDVTLKETFGGCEVVTNKLSSDGRIAVKDDIATTEGNGLRIDIDSIEAVDDNYTFAVKFGNINPGLWIWRAGYVLLCKASGEYVVVEVKTAEDANGNVTSAWLSEDVLAKGKASIVNGSLSMSLIGKSDTEMLIRVNDSECTISVSKLPTKYVLGNICQDFSVNGTKVTYTTQQLTAPLKYRLSYMRYYGNVTGSSLYRDYTKVIDYYRASGEVPEYRGMAFGGWYNEEYKVLQEGEQATTYYAKFLPKDVLSVKAQLKLADGVSTTDTSGTTQMRLITTVDDTLNFAEVGFVVTSGTTSKTYPRYTAYSSLSAAGVEMTPSVFNACSKRFATVNIGNVTWNETTKLVDRPITVQAYWKTYDGTIVYGATRTLTIQQGLEAIEASAQPFGLR